MPIFHRLNLLNVPTHVLKFVILRFSSLKVIIVISDIPVVGQEENIQNTNP